MSKLHLQVIPSINDIKVTVLNENNILKVYRLGPSLNKELAIQELLKDHNNIAPYIDAFECPLENIVWSNAQCSITVPNVYIIVMKHFQSDLATLLRKADLPLEIFVSVIKQAAFAMLQFHIEHGIIHNSIRRGNVLVDVGDPKILTYNINNNISTISTLGYEVKYIDFQRGSIININNYNLNNNNNNLYVNNIILQLAIDELSLLFDLMSKWTKNIEYSTLLNNLMNNIMKCKSLNEVFLLIDKFPDN